MAEFSAGAPIRRPEPPEAPVVAADAVIVTVGDEIVSGDVTDTNAAFLGSRCRTLGLTARRTMSVRDRVDEIVPVVREAAAAARVCLVTGGLGPTTDDCTALAVARAAGVELERRPDAERRLQDKFEALGRPMPEPNRKQADFPRGAEVLANPVGTAEGFALDLGACRLFVMPGVPREMKEMMASQVEPWVRAYLPLRRNPRRIYRIVGRGESSVATVVEPVVEAARQRSAGLAAMFVHYRAATPEVELILEATPGPGGEQATDDELRSFDAPFAEAIGPALYGVGTESLASRLLARLQTAGRTIATAESCTAGGVGRRLGAVPGASASFVGGVIAYDNRIKTGLLGVPEAMLAEHGAVSEPVARQMAEGARSALGADLAVAVTGIAGPSGGTREKPVGTVHFAVSDAGGTDHKRLQLRGDRGTVQRASELWALKLAWDRLGPHPLEFQR